MNDKILIIAVLYMAFLVLYFGKSSVTQYRPKRRGSRLRRESYQAQPRHSAAEYLDESAKKKFPMSKIIIIVATVLALSAIIYFRISGN